jgi:uncharacterized membrane protein
MRSKLSIKGHPLHPLLVTLPVGLFVWTLVADLVFWRSADPVWFAMAYWSSVAGIVTALIAAVFGFGDYFTMARYTQARGIARTHMIMNLVLVGLFVVAAMLMRGDETVRTERFATVLFLHVVGVIVLLVSGWLGGEMVFRHRLAVLEEAERLEARRRAADDILRHELPAARRPSY